MDRSIILFPQSFIPVRQSIHVTMEELARLMSGHTDVIVLVQITTDQCAKQVEIIRMCFVFRCTIWFMVMGPVMSAFLGGICAILEL